MMMKLICIVNGMSVQKPVAERLRRLQRRCSEHEGRRPRR
jgi:hypothetical protein